MQGLQLAFQGPDPALIEVSWLNTLSEYWQIFVSGYGFDPLEFPGKFPFEVSENRRVSGTKY